MKRKSLVKLDSEGKVPHKKRQRYKSIAMSIASLEGLPMPILWSEVWDLLEEFKHYTRLNFIAS